jgi:hypothetical protein
MALGQSDVVCDVAKSIRMRGRPIAGAIIGAIKARGIHTDERQIAKRDGKDVMKLHKKIWVGWHFMPYGRESCWQIFLKKPR